MLNFWNCDDIWMLLLIDLLALTPKSVGGYYELLIVLLKLARMKLTLCPILISLEVYLVLS